MNVVVREYFEEPPGRAEVDRLIDLLGGAAIGRPPEAVSPLLK